MNEVPLEAVARGICETSGFVFKGSAGQGAFKETFRVESGGRDLALKIYRTGFPVERTGREFTAITRCNHPNIGTLTAIATYSFGGADFLYSLEEFHSGGTLTSTLADGALQPRLVKEIGTQLIDAISHVASHDLVHRDVKPDNILFKADRSTPVLVDFGLVRDLRSVSLTQTYLMRGPGTPLFAPPEQLLNDKPLIDWRSDQFSLGVTLSYAAFNAHPYSDEGLEPVEIVERVAERKPLPSWFVEKARTVGLPALVRMVAAWPVGRYRTPDDLKRAWVAQIP